MTLRTIKFYIALLFILLPNLFFAQTVSGIDITGNKEFSESNYLNWINISPGTDYFPGIIDSAELRIAGNLKANGYFNFTFPNSEINFSDDSSRVNLSIVVGEENPTYVKNIFIAGIDSSDSVIVNESTDFLKDEIFIQANLKSAISEILDHFENNGFPFASVKISSVSFYMDSSSSENYADIYLSVNKNQRSTIDKVEITGNEKTNDDVIIRNIRMTKGEKYSEERIKEIPKQLNRLRFFEPVEDPKYFLNSKGEGILQINVKEKETNYFDGIIGYVPGTGDNGKGYFTGFVNVSLRNLFGTGRAAGIRWQREDRNSQELELKYLEPWLFGYPFNVNLGLFQRKQDTTYVQRNFEGSVEYLATENISASFIVSSGSTIPTDNGTNLFTVYNSSSFQTGINLKIDTRDDFYAPTEGILFLNTYKFSSKKIGGPDRFITSETVTDINLQRLELDFSYFLEIFNKQVIALGLHGRELRGSFLELSDLYLLGGTNTLRGYREKQFAGNRLFWSNFEYRYLFSNRSFIFTFFDTGYFLRNANEKTGVTRISGFYPGYGLGINLETGLGVLSVSFALGKGDSFTDGKIHFGIINEF